MSRHSSILVFFLATLSCTRAAELPKLYEVPRVSLVADSGSPFDLASLRGEVVIYDFIFTRCSGICPVMSKRMSELQAQIDRDEPVRFVSVSVDPAHDTPAVLRDYAKRFRRDERWLFLTGDREAIIRLSVNGFKLAAGEPGHGSEPILHSNRFVLVDREAVIRGYYDSSDPAAMASLLRDAGRLAKEK